MLHIKAPGTNQCCDNVDSRHTNSLHVALNCSLVLCCTMLETASAIRGMAVSNTELVCKDNIAQGDSLTVSVLLNSIVTSDLCVCSIVADELVEHRVQSLVEFPRVGHHQSAEAAP